MSIESDFAAAITAAGLTSRDKIIADGKIHRFASDGTRNDDAGWYVLHVEDPASGAFGCWRKGIKEIWCSRDKNTLSTDERREVEKRSREARRKARRELESRQAKATANAEKEWRRAKEPGPDHAYLVSKSVKAYGIRQAGNDLLIPLCDAAGDLQGVQYIDAEGTKKFFYGTAKRGHFHLIGEPGARLIIAEGYATAASIHEATGDAVVVAFDAGNLQPVAEALHKKFAEPAIVIASDNDKSGIGQRCARKAAAAVRGKVVICPDVKDFNDLHQAHGLDAVREAFAAAADPEPEPESIDDAIKRLAQLNPIGFDRVAEAEATKLGCNLGTLREEVKRARRKDGNAADNGQGRPIEFAEIEPWPEPVNGTALLEALVAAIMSYVIISALQAVAIALWVVFTHAFDAFDVSPKLIAKSAQKRSGKSRLAEVLHRLVRHALLTSGIKPAALLRIIEMHAPTLLLDEMDAAMKQDREMAEALRGLINSGFNRGGARYIMNVPTPDGGFEPRQFSTWAPQSLFGIGDLPDTVRDRSLEIEMRRKLKGEKVKRLRRKDGDDLRELQRKLARWAADSMENLRNARPEIPSALGDRAADAWEPLFAIADLAGGDLPKRARTAALTLSGDDVVEDDNPGTMLLLDIREIFESDGRAKARGDGDKQIASAELASALGESADRPWADYRNGKAITPTGVARLLKPYGIRPGTKRDGKDTDKGYRLSQFRDAFARYLPPQTVTPSQPKQTAAESEAQNVTPGDDVTVSKARKLTDSATCDSVTDENPSTGQRVRL